MKQLLKNAGILFGITLIAGILLGFVYELTKEPIAYQQELKVQRACSAVFADAASFEAVLLPGEDAASQEAGLIGSPQQNGAAMEVLHPEGVEIGTVYRALSASGELLGYVINTTGKEGYGGNIELMIGVRMDGTLNGVSILSISETPGLGMRAEEVLVPQFAGRQVSSFTYVKTGAVTEDQIDAISGATITTSAFTQAVNAGLSYFNVMLKEGED
ncbi:MAG: RnfABCDGE type electron transport complex subunit G [Lachnospiraceae bacterium]|nr:RnfABCDGE type electron transport complex subunit G [Lachnospiraceae bacterium]